MTDTAILTSEHSSVLHTSPICGYVRRATDPHSVDPHDHPEKLWCSACEKSPHTRLYIANSEFATVVHARRDCPDLQRATAEIIETDAYGRSLCQRCDPTQTYRPHDARHNGWDTGECRSCGAMKDPDGTCGFCERFEAVIAGD